MFFSFQRDFLTWKHKARISGSDLHISMLQHYAGSPQELVHGKAPQTCGLQSERLFLFFFFGGGGGGRGLKYVPSCWRWLREDSGSHVFKLTGHESVLTVPKAESFKRDLYVPEMSSNFKIALGRLQVQTNSQFSDKHDHEIPSQSTPIPRSLFKHLCGI